MTAADLENRITEMWQAIADAPRDETYDAACKQAVVCEARMRAEFSARERARNAGPDLLAALIDAVKSSGFSVAGPTDPRAAEDGEPAWVCRAREVISRAR